MNARQIATRIAAWRNYPSAAFTAGIPLRLVADPGWREQHLIAPRLRLLQRKATR